MSGMDRRSGDRSTSVDLGKFTLVRFNSHGKRLELVVDPEQAWLRRQGDDIPIDDIVEGYIFFENFSRGFKANDEDVFEIFETDDMKKAAELMVLNGDLQITQEQRKQFLKEKREEIIDYLVTHAVNPRTKAPHPADRLEKAMDDAGIQIDRNEPASEQAKRMIEIIDKVLPIQIETATLEFVVPPKDTGPLYGYIQTNGELVNENWGSDGTLTMVIRVPAGMVANLLEEISDRSKGRVRSTVIDRSD